jgi:hypothetical protein
VSDEEIMAKLREIGPLEFDAAINAQIKKVERAGAHLTMFEVIETGVVLAIVHETPRPTMKLIRKSYEGHLARLVLQ